MRIMYLHRHELPKFILCFGTRGYVSTATISYEHSVLTKLGFYEFMFVRDGPYFFKEDAP